MIGEIIGPVANLIIWRFKKVEMRPLPSLLHFHNWSFCAKLPSAPLPFPAQPSPKSLLRKEWAFSRRRRRERQLHLL